MARPGDTSPDARRVQRAILRRMTGPERVAMAFEMREAARALTQAGIRHRRPDWTDSQVQDALVELLLERELANAGRSLRPRP